MRKAKYALVQFNSVIGDVEGNVSRAEGFIKQAASQGADIICFPELFTCGYNTPTMVADRDKLSVQKDGPIVAKMRRFAAENNIYVVMPCNKCKDGKHFNGLFLFDRKGNIVGEFEKVHLWADEAKIFEKGSEYNVYDLDFGKLGLLICYDAGFPEAARMLALKGAEAVLIGGAFGALTWKRWIKYFSARALENTMYVAGINATGGNGTAGDEIWFGNNRFYDIDGELIREGLVNMEEMQIVEVDMDRVPAARQEGCYLTDLRPETYDYSLYDGLKL